MMFLNNIFNSIDEKKLKRAIELVKEMIGPAEAAKLERSFNEQKGAQIASTLSANDLAMVKTVIENPELLKKILSTPQGKQAVSKIIK